MEDYKKLYEQTQSKMKEFIKRWDGIKLSSNDLFTEELKQIVDIENEDERLRKTAISFLKDFAEQGYENAVECIDWLEKQGKKSSWKPSKEEMDVLYSLSYTTNEYDEHKEDVITHLYQDLKREFFNDSSYENMFSPDNKEDKRSNT